MVDGLRRCSDLVGYSKLPPEIIGQLRRVDSEFGSAQRAALLKSVLVRCMAATLQAQEFFDMPEGIRVLIHKEFNRINATLESAPDGFYTLNNDLYLKDLALARMRLIPAGARLLDCHSGVPRSIFWRDDCSQALRVLRQFVFDTRGFKPFYQAHVHLSSLQDFNAEGWIQMFRLIAQMFTHDESARGFFGASWFYDPALDAISPHLSYMRKFALDRGAELYFYEDDKLGHSGALSKSRTRRALFEARSYMPRIYYLVWSRSSLMRWARASG